MKKLPRKKKQWAEEAYEALLKALALLNEEHPSPSEDEKLELISYGALFAAMNRGIKDAEKINNAQQLVIENCKNEFSLKEPGEPIYHSINFLLAYFDSLVSYGYISEAKSDDILEYLSENYEISIPV